MFCEFIIDVYNLNIFKKWEEAHVNERTGGNKHSVIDKQCQISASKMKSELRKVKNTNYILKN